MNLSKLANTATPEKPTVAFHVEEHDDYYAIKIPKKVSVDVIRETSEKQIPFFVGLPVTGTPGGAILNLTVVERTGREVDGKVEFYDASQDVRFRLGSMNLFVAKK